MTSFDHLRSSRGTGGLGGGGPSRTNTINTAAADDPHNTNHDDDADVRHHELSSSLSSMVAIAQPSLIIPITSSTSSSTTSPAHSFNPNYCLELFPEEVSTVPPQTLVQILHDEQASMTCWADAALLYVQSNKVREGSEVLNAALGSEHDAALSGDRDERVRLLASCGLINLIQASKTAASSGGGSKGGGTSTTATSSTAVVTTTASGTSGGGAPSSTIVVVDGGRDDLRAAAEDRFNQSTRIDQLFPMTWIGRGILNLLGSVNRLEQARFFFDTTLKQQGEVLPALLGMAAVRYAEGNYKEAQSLYGKGIELYGSVIRNGSSIRVGYGMCCYRLDQVSFEECHRTFFDFYLLVFLPMSILDLCHYFLHDTQSHIPPVNLYLHRLIVQRQRSGVPTN